jgi:hypothetical protein
LKLNPAPHVPDDIVDSLLQQFQPPLERPGIRRNEWEAKKGVAIDGNSFAQIICLPYFFPSLFDLELRL